MIPEVLALESRPGVIRIPNQIDVPTTRRVMRLIDSPPMRRLSKISQLGLVADVYPGARHTRFEHSLGVYRNSLLFLRQLFQFDSFAEKCDNRYLESVVVAALLHDIGHWPYCHLIEDINLAHVPSHEQVTQSIILDSPITELIENEWECEPALVADLIAGKYESDFERLLGSILSGPIDVDKMDYLYRDSLHCGVPYGMNFDSARLINALGVNSDNSGIAISSKGKTASEMMVFARYVMFSEVYWHHTVRSATAMLQRLCFDVHHENSSAFYENHCDGTTDLDFTTKLARIVDTDAHSIFNCLFGSQRRLFKRVAEHTCNESPEIFNNFAHRPYRQLAQYSNQIAKELRANGIKIQDHEILIDAPPPGLEVQFRVAINDNGKQRQLEDVSPIVKTLATEQFDAFVKKVRVFAHPEIAASVGTDLINAILHKFEN